MLLALLEKTGDGREWVEGRGQIKERTTSTHTPLTPEETTHTHAHTHTVERGSKRGRRTIRTEGGSGGGSQPSAGSWGGRGAGQVTPGF